MKLLKSVLVLSVVALASSAIAFEKIPQNSSEFESNEDQEIELMMKAREAQHDFFLSLMEYTSDASRFNSVTGQCTYVSAIFAPPPPKTVALTFDDGPSEELTPEVLRILKKYGIKATFFMKGVNASPHLSIVKRVVSEGHMVGNHSWSHPNFHEISQQQQVGEVTSTDAVLAPYMKPLRLFRYPYGNSTCSTNYLIKSMGYNGIVGWHVDSCDWAFSKNGSVDEKQAKICNVRPENVSNFVGHVVQSVRQNNGGIILMHEVHVRTVANLESVIIDLKRDGFVFTQLSDPRMAVYFH